MSELAEIRAEMHVLRRGMRLLKVVRFLCLAACFVLWLAAVWVIGHG